MTTQLQPPLSKPAPQSFELNSLAWWGRSGIWIVGILVIAVCLMQQPYPRGEGRHLKGLRNAVGNARMIWINLSKFREKYGKFPDAGTVAPVRRDTATDLNLGTKSSNDFFRQLIATGIVQEETFFYAKVAGARIPDNTLTKAEALQKGECGFTYFLGATESDNPKRPVAATPMIPGTDRFDPGPFKGRSVVLWADGSVTTLNIGKDGHARLDRKNLMDPSHPIWDGHPPVIAWPEL